MRSTSEIVLESADVDKTTAAKKWAPRDWRADLTDVSLYSVRGGGVEEKRDDGAYSTDSLQSSVKLRLDLVPIVSVAGTQELRLEGANETLINRTFFDARRKCGGSGRDGRIL